MAYPADLLVPLVKEFTDPFVTESFTIPGSPPYEVHLGTSSLFIPPYPSGVALIPLGASPLALAPAPTAGTTSTTGGLTGSEVYKWAVSYVTKYGQTVPTNLLTVTLGSTVRGQTLILAIPPIPPASTPDNPVLSRRIWRTVAGGSQLLLVTELTDGDVTHYMDDAPDSELETPAPVSDTSGNTGFVSISGGSHSWQEQPLGTVTLGLGDFIVDYTVTDSGGTLTFSHLDAGVAVNISYWSATLLGSPYMNLIRTGLLATHDYLTGANVIFPNDLTVTGTGNLGHLVAGDGVISGAFEVLGATDLDGALDVAGASVLNGTLSALGNVTIQSPATFDAYGASTFHNTLTVVGTLTADAGSVLTGTVAAGANMTVANGLSVGGGLAVVTGDLNVTAGSLSLSGSLITGGAGTVGGGLQVHGDLGVWNDGLATDLFFVHNATGNTSISGTLGVGGSAQFDQNVHVSHLLVGGRIYPGDEAGSAGPTCSGAYGGVTVSADADGLYFTDNYGGVVFGTPSSPAAGAQFRVDFGLTKTGTPAVFVMVAQGTDGIHPCLAPASPYYVSNVGATGFDFCFRDVPAASSYWHVFWVAL